MAFADLSEQAKEGLNYAANTIKKEGVQTFADGKAYMDFGAEVEGCKWYETKQETRRLKRIAALEKPANAALAAQVDALG